MTAEQIIGGNVVITGASTGIGQACAWRLAQAGYGVFAGVRRQEDGERLRQEAPGEAGSRIVPLLLDVVDQQQITAAAEQVRQQVGEVGLLALVNNAGIAVGGPLEVIDIDNLRTQFEVNVIGQVAVTQAMLPLLRQGHTHSGRAHILMMGSIGGRLAPPFNGAYSGSKFALRAISDSLRMELHPWDIHVTLLEPGSIATSIWDRGIGAAEKRFEHMPDWAKALYGERGKLMLEQMRKTGRKGLPADTVAEVVQRAIESPRPPTRRLIGNDARAGAVVALLPDRLRASLILQQLFGKS